MASYKKRFENKNVLITGGSRGIGQAIATKFASEGARVIVTYREDRSGAELTLERVRMLKSDGFLIQANILNPDDISRMLERVGEELGTLHVFVNNARPAAAEFLRPPESISLAQWRTALDSQATAFLLASRSASALMPAGGRIVAITDTAAAHTGGLQPLVGMGVAKAALEALVRYFAVALAPREITVNAVSPGWTDGTGLNTLPHSVQEIVRQWHTAGWTPMRRIGTAADIANAVALVCDEDASWITGQVIVADGGASLMNPEVPTALQMAETIPDH